MKRKREPELGVSLREGTRLRGRNMPQATALDQRTTNATRKVGRGELLAFADELHLAARTRPQRFNADVRRVCDELLARRRGEEGVCKQCW